jgi:hypothetical protein
MTINMAPGQTRKHAGMICHRLFLRMVRSMWHFSHPLHLTTSLLQILKSTGNE